jgi:exopolysaccharide biosynthesis polyprenyl glycosylphosphotransferase
VFVWHIIFLIFGLYRSKRLTARWVEIFAVIKAISFGTLIVIGAGFLFSFEIVTPFFISVFWLTGCINLLLGRFIMRIVLARIRRRGHNLRFMLIVGTNRRGLQFAKNIEAKKQAGYRVIGFVDDDWWGIEDFSQSGFEVVTSLDGFSDFVRHHVVDEVVICLPLKSHYDQLSQILRHCEEQGIIVRFLPNIFDLTLARSSIEQFQGEAMMVYKGGIGSWQIIAKRMFDIPVAAALLTLFSPLFLIVSLLIKISSTGSVFFVQRRLGLNKRIFKVYKFRTMFSDAEQKRDEIEHLNEVSGPVFKIKKDPRVTPLGKYLRITSIDELPQLINVLKGDMSLVGPRPLPVRDYNGFDQDWYRRRFSIRPGITCLWQVNGRSNIPFEQWMELDMEYIDQWSFWLDLRILIKTIPAVFRTSGAQ